MSTEGMKGSNEGTMETSEGAPNSEKGKQTPDTDGEAKIQADVEEHEKMSPRSSQTRSDGRKSSSPDRCSRSGSGERQPGSSASSEEKIFEAKPKKKVKQVDIDPDGHEVTFTVTISIAVPTGET